MSADLSGKAMAAALIMDANSTLTHYPDPGSTPTCYTTTGDDAAGKSNLYLGPFSDATAISPIRGYLDDDGSGNTAVGHRRWVLFSRLTQIGSGTTAHANALYVLDSASWRPSPVGATVSAWPSAGFFPAQLEPQGRWSTTIANADFSAATVSVKDGTTRIPTTVVDRSTGYGDNTITFQVSPKYDISQRDRTFTVTIRGYRVGGVSKSTTYTTTLFDATVGLPDRNVISFPWPAAKPVGVTFDPKAKNNNGLTVYYASSTPNVCRANFAPTPSVTTLAAGTCTIMAYVGHDDRWPDADTPTRSFTVR